jgi:hypothetical protein
MLEGWKSWKKTKLNFQDFNKKSREGIYVGPPQADSQFSLCDISIPVSTDGELATHRTREIAPNRRPSTNNAIEIGHLDY